MANANIQPRMKKRYDEVIRKELLETFNYKNEMQILIY